MKSEREVGKTSYGAVRKCHAHTTEQYTPWPINIGVASYGALGHVPPRLTTV